MCSPLLIRSKSNHIAAFALDLTSTYEGEHMIFGLLSLADLAQNDVLQLEMKLHFQWGDKSFVSIYGNVIMEAIILCNKIYLNKQRK
jgi:hypothetical protein